MVLVCSCHNIGSHRFKNLTLGTSVPVLVLEITIWGDYKHDNVCGVVVHVTILGPMGKI